MSHPKRVLILGAYGTGNLGDELILDSLIRLLTRAYPGCEVRALSHDPAASGGFHSVLCTEIPPYVTARAGASAVVRGRWGWFLRVRETRRAVRAWVDWCDLFVLGGGNLLTDHPYYFLEHFAGQIVRLAARQGKPVAVLGTGFGPINTPNGQRLLDELAGWTTAAALRETAGAEAFAAAGFEDPRVCGDPVLLEPPFPDQAPLEPVPRALVNLRPLPGRTLPNHVLLAIDTLKRSMDVVGLAMHPALDEPALLAGLAGSPVLDAPSPARVVAEVRRSSLVIGMRLHACLVAATFGVPVVSLAYHHKVTEFARTLGLGSISLDGRSDGREVVAVVNEIDERRRDLESRVKHARRAGLTELEAALTVLPFDPPARLAP